jgi:hypothetical protein
MMQAQEAVMLDGLVDVILDSDLGGATYEFERETEIVDVHGYLVPETVRSVLRGNIQPLTGREHGVLPEGGEETESIVIFTPEELSCGGPDRKPDRVFYRGAAYIVRLVEPWREAAAVRPGEARLTAGAGSAHAGFTRAVAVAVDRHCRLTDSAGSAAVLEDWHAAE